MKLFSFLVLVNLFLLSQSLDIEQPELQIVIEPEDESEPNRITWEKVNNGTGIMSRSKSTLELFCTAAYPIQWDLTGFVEPMDIVVFQPSKRFLTQSTETYEIRVILFFNDESSSSAWVECQGVEEPRILNSRIAVFVPGLQVFAKNIHNNNAPTNNTVSLRDSFVLPCGVTDPTISVQIQLHDDDQILPVSGSYDHVDGFTLDFEENPIPGIYSCQTETERLNIVLSFSNETEISPEETSLKSFTTEDLTLKCAFGDKDPIFRVTGDVGIIYPSSNEIQLHAKTAVKGNVTCTSGKRKYVWQYEFIERPRVHIDNFEGEIYCLSDHSERSVATVRCRDSIDCEFKKHCLENEEACNLERFNYFKRIGTNRCWIQKENRGANCASIAFHHLNGIVECTTGGLKTSEEFFVSLKMKRYTNWMDAPKEELVGMDPIKTHFPTSSPITVFCEATSFLFADSIKFQLEFKNGTRQFVNDSLIKTPSREDERKIDEFNIIGILTMKVPQDAVSVHCLAPWWNSTEYLSVETRFLL